MTFEEALEIVREEEVAINKDKKKKITVYGSEGNLPHLHYYLGEKEGCVRLDTARYFCHEPWHEGLNADEKKWLIHWLMDNDYSNWKKCILAWNKDSKQSPLSLDIKPNYKLLPVLQPNNKLAKGDRM